MNARRVKLFGVLGFILIAIACFFNSKSKIEKDLTTRSTAALTLEGIPVDNLLFSGRDATLSGILPSEDQVLKAQEVVAEVYGVRKVTNMLTVEPTTPEIIEVDQQKRIEELVTVQPITFDAGTYALTEEAKRVLDEIAMLLAGQPQVSLLISGHTDDSGQSAFNLKLSQDRADAVKAYLVSRGIDATRLFTQGLGETRPVAENATEEGREKNRRVEFTWQEEN